MEQTCRCLCSLLLLCVKYQGVRSSGQVPGQSTFLVTSTSHFSGHLPDHHRVESFSRPESNRVKIRCSSHNTFLPLCSRDTRRWVVKRTTESRVGERAGCLCFLTPTCDGIPECAHRHSILKWHFSAHVVTRPSLAECLFLEQTHGHSQCASLVCLFMSSRSCCTSSAFQFCCCTNSASRVIGLLLFVLLPHTNAIQAPCSSN